MGCMVGRWRWLARTKIVKQHDCYCVKRSTLLHLPRSGRAIWHASQVWESSQIKTIWHASQVWESSERSKRSGMLPRSGRASIGGGGAGRRARRKLLALRIITELGVGDFLEHHAIARRRAFLPDVERVRHLFLRNGTAVRRKLDVAHTRKRHDQ